MNYKVSIIVPIYNVENYLLECLESIENQTLDNIEVIAVNDGSTDRSPEILEAFCKGKENYKIVNQDNGGVSKARNVGVSYATGEYVYFLDSDDMIKPNLCAECYKMAEENSLDVVLFDADVFYEENMLNREGEFKYEKSEDITWQGVVTGEEMYCVMHEKKCYTCSVVLIFIRRNYLNKEKHMFYEGILHEDELYTPILLIKAERVIYMAKQLFIRRVRGRSIMTNRWSYRNCNGYLTVAEELINFIQKEEQKSEKTIKIVYERVVFFLKRAGYIIGAINRSVDENKMFLNRIKKLYGICGMKMPVKLRISLLFPVTYRILYEVKQKLKKILKKREENL